MQFIIICSQFSVEEPIVQYEFDHIFIYDCWYFIHCCQKLFLLFRFFIGRKLVKIKTNQTQKNNAKLGNNVNRFAAPTWMVPSSTMLLTCKCPFFCFYYVNKVVCASTNPCIFGVYFYRTFAVIKALWNNFRSLDRRFTMH